MVRFLPHAPLPEGVGEAVWQSREEPACETRGQAAELARVVARHRRRREQRVLRARVRVSVRLRARVRVRVRAVVRG